MYDMKLPKESNTPPQNRGESATILMPTIEIVSCPLSKKVNQRELGIHDPDGQTVVHKSFQNSPSTYLQ